jgi:N utilization substance protein A
MARKKTARKKKTVSRKKTTQKKITKIAGIAKIAKNKRKQVTRKKVSAKTKSVRKKSTVKKKSATKKKPATRKATRRREEVINPVTPSGRRGLGPESGGQSGDTQGLSRRSYDDSESVEELMEEGQYMEAEAVSGVENAPDADQGEVRTRQFPEDDVPEEYKDEE